MRPDDSVLSRKMGLGTLSRRQHDPGPHTRFRVTRLFAGQIVYLVENDQHLLVFDDQGTQLMKYRWPRPGIKYVGSGRPRGRQPRQI